MPPVPSGLVSGAAWFEHAERSQLAAIRPAVAITERRRDRVMVPSCDALSACNLRLLAPEHKQNGRKALYCVADRCHRDYWGRYETTRIPSAHTRGWSRGRTWFPALLPQRQRPLADWLLQPAMDDVEL